MNKNNIQDILTHNIMNMSLRIPANESRNFLILVPEDIYKDLEEILNKGESLFLGDTVKYEDQIECIAYNGIKVTIGKLEKL